MDPMMQYRRWCEKALADADIIRELEANQNNSVWIEDAFYRELAFGTGGLRGVIGAGTNRMNIYTVAKASQGLADYIRNHFSAAERKIAVSYDSRIKSRLFAETSCGVFAANGIHAYIYPVIMPTPCLSYAVRELNCAAGVMITASHNPSKYNGYKVYGSDGCQITNEAAEEILAEIGKLDVFENVKSISFATGVKEGRIEVIGDDIYDAFVEEVKKQSLYNGSPEEKGVRIIYSPLNGTGLRPVMRTLTESGYTNITVVKEQEQPDGMFPTCPYPNPEIREAMSLGIRYAEENNADLFLATDPDCDRCGIAVRNSEGAYDLLSGNETGMLLLDYICARRTELRMMPEDPVFIKTIVTIDMAERIAAHYGVRTINVLTGFKYIGEQIGRLEASDRKESFIFGFEESYGYLSGTYVRDKDAVNAAFMICEMFTFYKAQGISLTEKLKQLYTEYGYCLNTLHSFEFEGASGFRKMNDIMGRFRGGLQKIGSKMVSSMLDYSDGLDGLPKADVLKFLLAGGGAVVIRPSGTEPKLKVYLSVSAPTREEAEMVESEMAVDLAKCFR